MFIEFLVDYLYTDQEAKDLFRQLKDHYAQNIDYILISEHHHRIANYFFAHSKINIYIDYPLGLSATDNRMAAISNIYNKCDTVSIQAPSSFIVNRKYDRMRKEISLVKEKFPNINLRYIIDYRKYNHNILAKFASILMENEIDILYPSTGFFIDNIYDNILACKYLQEKSKIKPIVNANMWTKDHIDLIIKLKPVGINVQNIHSLSLIKQHYDPKE